MNPSLSSWLLLNGTTQFGGAPKSLQGVMNSANLAATLEKMMAQPGEIEDGRE
jgi:hypothetical protein